MTRCGYRYLLFKDKMPTKWPPVFSLWSQFDKRNAILTESFCQIWYTHSGKTKKAHDSLGAFVFSLLHIEHQIETKAITFCFPVFPNQSIMIRSLWNNDGCASHSCLFYLWWPLLVFACARAVGKVCRTKRKRQIDDAIKQQGGVPGGVSDSLA